jgi:hypothetical protein
MDVSQWSSFSMSKKCLKPTMARNAPPNAETATSALKRMCWY